MDAYREVRVYVGHILKGAKPEDLPVVQSTKLELVINHQTARILDLTVPDKLVHATEFAILGFLALRARAGGGITLDRRAVVVALMIGICVGALDENYQRLIPQRDSSAKDWVADVVGTALGVLIAAGLFLRQRRARRRTQ